MKTKATTMKATGVLRWVTLARSASPMTHPATHVQARITHRSSGALYSCNASATTNHPTTNGQITVRYQSIPEEMS
jgi:hypothetical protein